MRALAVAIILLPAAAFAAPPKAVFCGAAPKWQACQPPAVVAPVPVVVTPVEHVPEPAPPPPAVTVEPASPPVAVPPAPAPVHHPAAKGAPRRHATPVRAKPRAAVDTGPDLPWPCFVVRAYAAGKSRAQLEAAGRANGVSLSAKQRHQAAACLGGA